MQYMYRCRSESGACTHANSYMPAFVMSYKRGVVRRDWGAGEGGNQQPAFGWSDRNPVF